MAKKTDWDVFWKQAWRNLFHALGMVAVLAAIIGACVSVWIAFFSSSSDNDRKAQRELFQKVVMQAPQPCAVKKEGAKFSNLEGCTLFRLRPGMSRSDILSVINSSGYFENRAYFHDPVLGKEYCSKNKDKEDKHGNCKYYIYIRNQAFTLSIHFDDRWEAEEVTLIFGQDAHPYSDLKSIRALLIKMVGLPDESSSGGHDTWGEREQNGKWNIHAYTNDNRLWVIFKAGPAKKESGATAAK